MSLQGIIKTNNIIRIALDDNLASALSKLRTSHDSAFLFNDKEQFVGLVNPYYCLIKSSYPGNAKVEHCVYHPPKIYIDYSVEKTAELLIESKIHYLPIFDRQEHFVGIISARRLMQHFRSNPALKIKIKDILKHKNRPLSLIFEDDTVQRAVNLFKLTKHSKLIVVNKNEKLKGILSYYDLISYLVAPKKTEKRGEREGNKVNFYHHKVKNFSKSYVLTLSLEDTLDKAINLIIDKRIGSIVIVDEKRYPVGIITTRDLLRFFIQKTQGNNIEMMSENLSQQGRRIFGGFFSHVINPVAHTLRKFKKDD
ncbi:CBS domain-containing protein [Candidatus Roizmanbacteria bacterium]|nr:CBS domain-containing protein [Candidatus Roizmanbacteria bacterium]